MLQNKTPAYKSFYTLLNCSPPISDRSFQKQEFLWITVTYHTQARNGELQLLLLTLKPGTAGLTQALHSGLHDDQKQDTLRQKLFFYSTWENFTTHHNKNIHMIITYSCRYIYFTAKYKSILREIVTMLPHMTFLYSIISNSGTFATKGNLVKSHVEVIR